MAEHLDPATATAARARSRGEEVAPSTPPTAGLAAVQYASDPENAQASGRSRGRRLGIRVGRRRSGAATATSRERAGVAGGYGDDGAADIGAGARAAAAAAAAAAAGGGGHRRPSAGRRFGAMLRRGAPSLHHLRRSSGSGGGKNADPKPHADSPSHMQGADFLPLPSSGMSPPLQLDDPPEGHVDHNDENGRDARAVTGSTTTVSRRRFTRSKSALGASGRHLGRYEGEGNDSSLHADSFPGGGSSDAFDHHGGGGNGSRGAADGDSAFIGDRASFTVLARNAHDGGDDGDSAGRGAYWSGSDLDRSGDRGEERSGRPSTESAEASDADARRAGDRSVPPPERALLPGADVSKAHYGAAGGKEEERSGGVRTVDTGRDRRGGGETRHTVDGSSSARPKVSGWKKSKKKTRRRIVEGYMSAPDDLLHRESGIGDKGGGRGVTLEVDECIARAEAALFATDTISDAEIDGGGGSSDGDEEAAAAAATAAPAATRGGSGGSGRHATISKRRRLTGLLNFRRRSSSNSVATSLSSSAPGDSGTPQNGVSVAGGAANGGKPAVRRESSTAPHRRGALNRSNSTSALDRVVSRDQDGEDGMTTTAAGTRGNPAGRTGGGAKRRLLPGGSSTGVAAGAGRRGASVSPEKHRRHRDSFLEAGKDKLRRGRSKLSRGSFGGRSSSHRRHRANAPPEGEPWEGSQEGEKSGPGEEEGGGGGSLGERETPPLRGQGPPAKPQLGTTYTKRPDSTSSDDSSSGTPWNTWGPGSGSKFSVRTKGYGRTKVKAPSAPELYELASIDVYRSPAGRICGVYPMFASPACAPKANPATTAAANGSAGRPVGGNTTAGSAGGGRQGNASDGADTGTPPHESNGDGGSGTGHPDIPPVLVVNCQLPDVPTPFSVQGDGPTIHVIFTFRATPRLCDYAARVWAAEQLIAAGDGGGEVSPGGGDINTPGSEATPPAGFPPAGRPAGDAAAVPGTGAGLSADAGAIDGGGGGGSLLQTTASGSRATTPGGRESGDAGGGEQEEGGGEGGEYGEVPESVRLLVEWMRRAEHDGGFRGRFKAIGDIVNADEVGLPSIARRFSGKPILLYGKESSMVKGPGFAELDLNAHAFSYVGRKGLYITLDKWKRAIFRIGFLLEGRADEEQPEHMLGCGVFYGLDIYSLKELSLSPDGERLIVTNPDDEGNTAVATTTKDDSNNSNGNLSGTRGASSKEAVAAADPTALPSSSAVHADSSLWRNAPSSSPSLPSSSDVVPLIPRRHMGSLLNQHGSDLTGGGVGGGGEESTTVISPMKMAQPPRFFDDHGSDEEEDVTITAVAAAAFAGGWFCALLAMITMACWSELTGTPSGEGEEGRWRAGFGAWLVRVFMDRG